MTPPSRGTIGETAKITVNGKDKTGKKKHKKWEPDEMVLLFDNYDWFSKIGGLVKLCEDNFPDRKPADLKSKVKYMKETGLWEKIQLYKDGKLTFYDVFPIKKKKPKTKEDKLLQEIRDDPNPFVKKYIHDTKSLCQDCLHKRVCLHLNIIDKAQRENNFDSRKINFEAMGCNEYDSVTKNEPTTNTT